MTRTVTVRTLARGSSYNILIERGSLDAAGAKAIDAASNARLAVVVSNPTVFGHYGKIVEKSLRDAGLTPLLHLIGDGERFKSLRTLSSTIEYFNSAQLKRTDVVVALGGGIVGDLAGFAAAVHLRGVPFVQVPTTLLAMIDSSVGGKTGINTNAGKNLVGAFHQPAAVVIDPNVLQTLPVREVTAGNCEAVKQGALGGRKLLELTAAVLDAGIDSPLIEEFLEAQVRFKASVVAGDEREDPTRSARRSRKILNFGHTFAHAIEKLTRFRRFKHGEAVGHGVRFAALLSKKLEMLNGDELELLNGVVHRAGKLPRLRGIEPSEVIGAFRNDKKNIGDSLQWILLEAIGRPVITPNDKIPSKILGETLRETLCT